MRLCGYNVVDMMEELYAVDQVVLNKSWLELIGRFVIIVFRFC